MIDNMTRPMRRMAQKAANSARGMRGLANSAKNATGSLNRMGNVAGRSAGNLRKMGNDANFADRRLHRLARRMRNMQTVRLGMGGALTGLGTGLVTRQVGSTLIDYEKAMNKVLAFSVARIDKKTGKTILKGFENAKNPIEESENMIKAMRDKTQSVARVSIFDPTQVAGGLLELAKSGLAAHDSIAMLHPVMRLAGAGDLDPKTAVDIATNITKSFGRDIKSAADTVDILAMAASNANVDITELGQAMKYAAPSAKVGGRSLEETTGLMMSLAQRGYKGSIAGTTIARMLESVYKRSGPAVKALKGIGLSHSDFLGEDGNTIPVADMLDLFKRAAADAKIGREKVIMAIGAMMGSRGGRGAKLLFETASDEIRANEKLLKLSKDRAEIMEKLMMSGVYGAYERMRAAIVTSVIKLGEGGLSSDIESLADTVRSLANSFSELSPTTKKWIGRALLLATAISAVIIPLGVFAWAIGALIPMFALLLSPLGLVVAGLALLAAATMYVFDIDFSGIIEGARTLWKELQDPIAALEKLVGLTKSAWNNFQKGFAGQKSEKTQKGGKPILSHSAGGAARRVSDDFKSMFQKITAVIRDPDAARPVRPIDGKTLAKSQAAKEIAIRSSVESKVTVTAPPAIVLKGVDGRTHGMIQLGTSADKGQTQIESAATP